jgi:PqqD family protein of HPr-rel-A system
VLWQIAAETSLYLRVWNDEMVVYNSLSGDTHLLGVDAAQILLKLQQEAVNTSTLTEQLATYFPAKTVEESAQHVEQLLSQLNVLALIEPC